MTEYERVVGLFGGSRPATAGTARARLARLAAKVPWMLTLIVVVPTLAAAIYYLFIAAPIYVSEARFVVRARSQPQIGALGSVLHSVGMGLGPAETDAYEVHEYMLSRDAVDDLIRSRNLRVLLKRPEADFLARYPRPFEQDKFENLFQNYKRFVTVGLDSATGISTLRVEGFRPGDARAIADDLLAGGERVVNRLNDRAAADAVEQARRQVTEAEAQAVRAQDAVTAFRNRERIIDPDKSSVAGLELMAKLEAQLASMKAERAGLAAAAPQSPQLPVLDKRIAAFGAQVEAERSQAAGETNSLAPKIGQYEQLIMEREFAVKTLAAAEASLESARVEARRKQIYLERVVNPDLPDKPELPRRWLAILMVAVSSLVAYATIALIVAGLREHRQR